VVAIAPRAPARRATSGPSRGPFSGRKLLSAERMSLASEFSATEWTAATRRQDRTLPHLDSWDVDRGNSSANAAAVAGV
jgi:hypothetical protein